MTHAWNKYEEPIVTNLVDHEMVASSDPSLTCSTNETGRGRRTRILGEEFEDSLDGSSNVWIKLAGLAHCGR
jgi:hypothetical protein